MRRLFIIILLAPFIVYGQCKIKEEKDDFTGKTTKSVSAKFVRETLKTNIDVTFMSDDDIITLIVDYCPQYHTAIISSKGNKIIFLLKDGTKVEAENTLDTKGSLLANKTTSIRTYYNLKVDDMEKLKTQPILKIRIEHYEQSSDHEIKEKFDKFFKEALTCIMK